MEMMESILPYLPHLDFDTRSSSLSWSDEVEQILKGIEHGRIQSGKDFVRAICDLRDNLFFSGLSISKSAKAGFEKFFSEVMSPEESIKWFDEVFPNLAKLLLKLPSLLEQHYHDSAYMDINGDGTKVKTALRILNTNEPGVVCLGQELIAALLACSLFCLFPVENRHGKHLPVINFDHFFETLFDEGVISLDNRIWCIIIYFQGVTSKVPKGFVSFERRKLFKNAKFWRESALPLCEFKDSTRDVEEDLSRKAILVYPEGKNFGGDALGTGVEKGELCFMFCPELIVGMLFLPPIGDTEAIEVVGVERFTTLEWFKSFFQSDDVYVDATDVDTLGRRKTRIVAVDEPFILSKGKNHADIFLCEVNKALCAFMYQDKYQCDIGVSTGDWFNQGEKDPEIKAIIKWLAASQAQRPFIEYNTHVLHPLLGEVVGWISSRRWTVGDLWKKVIHYSTNHTSIGFVQWLQQEETPIERSTTTNKKSNCPRPSAGEIKIKGHMAPIR